MHYLWAVQVLLKNFAHAQGLSQQLKEASEALARRTGRPLRYLPSGALDKEAIAREIAAADGIERGLICILSAVELCQTYEIVRDRASKHIELMPRRRKCLYLYHYYHFDPRLGFMHARIQTWFPFSIQVCLNGREWVARQMDAAGLEYVKRDNCFTWLGDAERAQRLMDRQLKTAWPELLDGIARRLNPRHTAMLRSYRSPTTGRRIRANGRATFYSGTPRACATSIRGSWRQSAAASLPSTGFSRQRRDAKAGLLRAHGLIRKVPGTHRYLLTSAGRTIVTALITARNATTDSLTKRAA